MLLPIKITIQPHGLEYMNCCRADVNIELTAIFTQSTALFTQLAALFTQLAAPFEVHAT